MMRHLTTRELILGSFAVALAIVWIAYSHFDPAERTGFELRATARWAFVLFWLASTGRSLATLFGNRFAALARRSRDFGLAFASAQTVHLALVAWMLEVNPDPFPRLPLALFSIGAACVYVLVFLSIRRVTATFNPGFVRTVRSLAVEYIALIFLMDFLMDFAKNPLRGGLVNVAAYVPLIVLAIAGPVLRRGAALKQMHASLAELRDVTDYRGAI